MDLTVMLVPDKPSYSMVLEFYLFFIEPASLQTFIYSGLVLNSKAIFSRSSYKELFEFILMLISLLPDE